MAIGWKNESTRPAGRTTFGENNPVVHSKGMRNAERNGFTPSDPRQPSQPAKQERRDLPGSIPQRTVGGPAVIAAEVVGYATDGSGKFTRASHPNASRGLHGNSHGPTVPVNHSGANAPDTLPRSSDLRRETGTDSP
jgi:hypothetical protein